MTHAHCAFAGVVVDEDGRGIESSRPKNLLPEGAVPSLQQRHPLERPGRYKEASVRVAALSVHHWGKIHTHTHTQLGDSVGWVTKTRYLDQDMSRTRIWTRSKTRTATRNDKETAAVQL